MSVCVPPVRGGVCVECVARWVMDVIGWQDDPTVLRIRYECRVVAQRSEASG